MWARIGEFTRTIDGEFQRARAKKLSAILRTLQANCCAFIGTYVPDMARDFRLSFKGGIFRGDSLVGSREAKRFGMIELEMRAPPGILSKRSRTTDEFSL